MTSANRKGSAGARPGLGSSPAAVSSDLSSTAVGSRTTASGRAVSARASIRSPSRSPRKHRISAPRADLGSIGASRTSTSPPRVAVHSPSWGVTATRTRGSPTTPTTSLTPGNGRANAPVCESREWQPATPDSPIARSPHLATRIFGIPGNPSTHQLRSTTGPIVRNAGAVGQTGAEFSPDSLGTALRKARRSGAFVRRWGWSGSYGFQEFRAPGPLI